MHCLTCNNHVQGETAQEMAGLAEAMQAKAVPVHTSCDGMPLYLPAAYVMLRSYQCHASHLLSLLVTNTLHLTRLQTPFSMCACLID